jgi:hypothetical protein
MSIASSIELTKQRMAANGGEPIQPAIEAPKTPIAAGFPPQDLPIAAPSRGSMPTGLASDWEIGVGNRSSTKQRSAVYIPATPVIPGSDTVAKIQATIQSEQGKIVSKATKAAQAAATSAVSGVAQNASNAVATANSASNGVNTLNAQTAVAIVGGTLQQVPLASLGTAIATPNQDNLDDGTTFARVLSSALTSNAIDTTKAGVIAQWGCFPSTIVGTSAAIVSYTSTSTSATISWTSFTVFWADGTTATIASGTQNITGLTSGTYQYYPVIAAGSTTVTFISVSGAVGTPAIFYAGASPTAAQQQNLAINTALSIGSVTIHVTTGGSGSGGGSGTCVKADQYVIEAKKGICKLESCEPGDKLLSRHGYVEIQSLKLVPQKTFIKVETTSGTLFITPTHCASVIREGGEQSIPAAKLQLTDVMYGHDAYAMIKSISVVEVEGAGKAVIHVEPTHEFWCGAEAPTLSAHNQIPVS